MKRMWIILVISIMVLITAFLFFIFPGYYFTLESRKAESTTSGAPPPPTSASVPPTSTGPPPTPSGSYSPPPSYSQSGSSVPSGSASGSVTPSISGSISPSSSGTTGGGIWDILYGKEARESEVKSLSSAVVKPIVGVTAAAIATAFILNPLLSLLLNFPFRDLLYFFLNSVLEFLGIRKRRRPWGVVYDSASKNPVAGAVVKIIESSSGRVKEMKITDDQGRFGFLVDKGIYSLTVVKNGFVFPSSKITLNSKGGDGYYTNVYLGGNIRVEEGFLGVNIPLDLEAHEPKKNYLLFLRVVRFFERIRLPLLIFGTVFALINLFLFRSLVDFIIISLYLILWLFEIWQSRKIKPYGEVKNEKSNVLDLTVIRFLRTENSKLVTTSISDSRGRFFVLLPEGKFYLTAMKAGYLPYRSETINISRISGPPEIKVIMKKP